MDNTENVDERLLAAVMDEAQTDFSIASIADSTLTRTPIPRTSGQ